jgi:two-component system OmpR family response regulator
MSSIRKTVLVVDDEDSLRDFAAKLIEKRGYRVLTAANGNDALAVVKSGVGVDLVVLDVMMPGLDGLQTLEQMRSLQPGLFVILLTARTGDSEVLGGYKQGADYYITKPLRPAELLNIIDYLIGSLSPEERTRIESTL